MENVGTRFGFRSSWLKDDDPLYPCASVQLPYRRSCYVRDSTRILQLNSNNFADAARTCERAGSMWAPYCFRGFGRDAVVEARYTVIGKVLGLCRLAELRGRCLYGAARTFGDGAGLEGMRRSEQLCGALRAASGASVLRVSGSSSGCFTRRMRVVAQHARRGGGDAPQCAGGDRRGRTERPTRLGSRLRPRR